VAPDPTALDPSYASSHCHGCQFYFGSKLCLISLSWMSVLLWGPKLLGQFGYQLNLSFSFMEGEWRYTIVLADPPGWLLQHWHMSWSLELLLLSEITVEPEVSKKGAVVV
jgi:hypothetical protein